MKEIQALVLPGKTLSGRFVKIGLVGRERDAWCIAQLHDGLAPRNCDALWNALPQAGEATHAKYAGNEVYAMVNRYTEQLPLENQSITPAAGDVMVFDFSAQEIGNPAHGYRDDSVQMGGGATDLAIFYGRNNLLLNAGVGYVRGSVVASIVWGFEQIAKACNEVWRNSAGEQLRFLRASELDLAMVKDQTRRIVTKQLRGLPV